MPEGGSGEEPTVEELTQQQLRQLQTVARLIAMGNTEDLQGAMLVVANPTGIETYPYVSPEVDAREMSLHLLGMFLWHMDESTPPEMHPLDIADHALALLEPYKNDERVGHSIQEEQEE